MTKFFSTVIKYTLCVCVIIFLFNIFYPRSYNVPQFQKRANTQYWNLSTGSKIGYVLIKATHSKNPFPIIYLHGGPGGHISDRDINVLSNISEDGYLYDQIGSGQSDRLKNMNDYTVERHIKDLKEIIEQTGAKKVILIGQSWGCILALLFTADNPNKVERIIFTSPGPVYPVNKKLVTTKTPDSIHLRNPFFTNAQGNKLANNIRTKTMAFCATSFGKKIATDKEADEFATYLNYELNKSTVCDTSKILKEESGDGFYAGIMTLNSLNKVNDPRPKIQSLTIPVLVMKGECDNQEWGFTNEYLQLFKNHELAIIPKSGHFISVEQPELYIKTIRQFLNN